MTNKDQVVYAQTQNFSGSARYFPCNATAFSSNNVQDDPTVVPSQGGELRHANRIPSGHSVKCKGFEVELETAVPSGGQLEVELVVDGDLTGVKAVIAEGQTIGGDFEANQTITGGKHFCYKYTATGFTDVPGSSVTMIQENT